MGRKVHIICAKCGSDEMHFSIKKQSFDDIGVSIVCENCSELTGVEEWNDHNNNERHNIKVDDNGRYVWVEE